MGERMKSFRRLSSLAIAAVLLTAIAGCNDDVVVAARDVAPVIGHDGSSVTIHDLSGLAGRWHVDKDTLKSAATGIYLSPAWRKAGEDLSGLNEKTDGPARDIIVETACDLASKDQVSSSEISETFREKAAQAGRPWVVILAADAQEVTRDLQSAYHGIGITSGAQESRAAVALGCAINSTRSDLNAASG
jgi:hypothetical protein